MIEAHLTRALARDPVPHLSGDFETRLARRLRATPAPEPRAAARQMPLTSARRWALRLYWIGTGAVAVATIDAAAIPAAQLQALGAATAAATLLLQRLAPSSALGRVMRDALR